MLGRKYVMNQNSKPKARGKKTLRKKTSNQRQRIRTLPLIVPPKQVVRLGFEQHKLISSGTTEGSIYYYANGAYDIDPVAGNLTMIGFNQWMALYGVYRVLKFTAIVTACNLEAFPVRIASCFFPATTSSFLRSQWLNEHGREHKTLGPLTGESTVKFSRSIELDQLIKVGAYKGDLTAYYGTSATNPSSLASFNMAAATMSASVLGNGVQVAVTIFMDLELSFPIQLAQV